MTKLKQVYKCNVCGNIVEVVHTGAGELVCCNEPMNLMEENTVDAATEKHVPVIARTEAGIKVTVGEVPHPMEEKHYIEWIEITMDDGKIMRKWLKPGDEPSVVFCECGEEKCNCGNVVEAREYCNLHGLWKS